MKNKISAEELQRMIELEDKLLKSGQISARWPRKTELSQATTVSYDLTYYRRMSFK